MNNKINPFHELYYTESIDSDEFVKLFSPVLVEPSLPLFKPGNIILKGLPGSGKTMMLNLLKPSIRSAYKRAGEKFPVPSKFAKFIGAGINLIRSSISDFGQRPINESEKDDLNELSIFFGDFLNYWISRDILDSLDELSIDFSKEIGINKESKIIDDFIKNLIQDECWFGYLNDVQDWQQLKEKLRNRTNTYRSYLNYNYETIPDEIKKTKTSIGVPIITLVQKLRESKVIDNDVQIYIRIDQYEELTWLDYSIPEMGSFFQSVIHKLLAMRDSTVSYRIGTRPYDWQEGTQKIFGTSAQLESSRNYKDISIEEVLRRSESKRGYIFPQFAEDIFYKRIRLAIQPIHSADLLKEIFGDGLTPSEKSRYIVKTSREKVVKLDKKWPEKWSKFLLDLAEEDPFSAKLAEAWALQKGKSEIKNNIPTNHPYPWEQEQKKYWVKERSEQAVMQIASRTRQGIIWSGKDDILNLSGGNILVFLSLCQHIWEVWMRDQKNNSSIIVPHIDHEIQTLGALETSRRWFENISTTTDGKEMKLFIIFIGGLFYKTLTDDLSMSYPGQNGFSIVVDELESNQTIDKFLKKGADRGHLVVRPHTPKTKGKKRLKWYLNPVLSPYFKIPAIHTKEPMYVTIQMLDEWLVKSKAFETSTLKNKAKRLKNDSAGQFSIF